MPLGLDVGSCLVCNNLNLKLTENRPCTIEKLHSGPKFRSTLHQFTKLVLKNWSKYTSRNITTFKMARWSSSYALLTRVIKRHDMRTYIHPDGYSWNKLQGVSYKTQRHRSRVSYRRPEMNINNKFVDFDRHCWSLLPSTPVLRSCELINLCKFSRFCNIFETLRFQF